MPESETKEHRSRNARHDTQPRNKAERKSRDQKNHHVGNLPAGGNADPLRRTEPGMSIIPLQVDRFEDGVYYLSGTVDDRIDATEAVYATRTGALLRIDGVVTGAFDREHAQAPVDIKPGARVALEVEARSLPTHGLPAGPGLRWWWYGLRASQRPALGLTLRAAQDDISGQDDSTVTLSRSKGAYPLIGHAHLDVAWLWTYEETARKAMRTFAIAVDQLERDPAYHFIQSQPQLYAFVEHADPQFFDRVRSRVREGRFDASVAAMWVEPDCNVPSGESLLRQLLYAHRYTRDVLGVQPQVAWLPDSFGFPSTLPMLLAHAGIRYFATTKLEWNDTTRFAYPQFLWRGPDGSEVCAALIARYEGAPSFERIARAKQRGGEPVICGFSDGGGGVTDAMLADARGRGKWMGLSQWMQTLPLRRLPVYQDELYLEYHRGTYTTHHAVKAGNAALERALTEVEEAMAWCVAVKAPVSMRQAWQRALDEAWIITLRNQFHDVLPGTSITAVYADVAREYREAHEIIGRVRTATAAVLPRGRARLQPAHCAPISDGETYLFDNGLVAARLRKTGAIEDLRSAEAPNVVAQANVLALYRDRPKQWEAWNIDASYIKSRRRPVPQPGRVEDDALIVPFVFDQSTIEMRVRLVSGEPFLRIDFAVDWRERQTLLRWENWFTIADDTVTYGAPHGTLVRSAQTQTPAQRAKFEVPGQRFASAHDLERGVALFALDTYGWSGRALPKGGLQIGHSLLRGTTWPDKTADIGEHELSCALFPFAQANVSEIEAAWEQFAMPPRVRLFNADHSSVRIVACKPAMDGNGVIVRLRECDGGAAVTHVRCGGRMSAVEETDALEERSLGELPIEDEAFTVLMQPFGLRSFRVRFGA